MEEAVGMLRVLGIRRAPAFFANISMCSVEDERHCQVITRTDAKGAFIEIARYS
jgi:hypothetical protein